ncbi:MAG: ATP phosphoribosyltransferase regulatory subunit [Epsilonproteobacteria bacterium]|nr:ATP phosphoribosyltransferase regulatory subunit [Campylobacterota bacterium]NPA57140.1 ATP phosphoribosyltransferase regulatory subunit [Campylobacterota bacterium]
MVYEHEIPKGARLYFGVSARRKREIERVASEVLYRYGFEEIITPLFSYHQHLYVDNERELIRLNDEFNRKLTIRADSTVDVVRLITNRLGRSTEQRKWFYIQPIYRYPTKEYYQIGAEWLGSRDVGEVLKIVLEIFRELGIRPTLQLSNIRIPLLLDRNYSLPLEVLKRADVDLILKSEQRWIHRLLYLSDTTQIDDLFGVVPDDIERELVKLKEVVEAIEYDRLVIAPLYYAKMRYYQELFFRFFQGNETIAMGGEYVAQEMEACGFAIYTDTIIGRGGL